MDDNERRELWEAELEALQATYGIAGDGDDTPLAPGSSILSVLPRSPPAVRALPHSSSSSSSSSILSVLSRSPPAVRVLLEPRGCHRSASRFVRAELVLECTAEYPGEGGEENPVAASLAAPKGLGDARRAALLSRVRAAVAEVSASGELCVLGSLIEAALEALTEINMPEGDCPICLEALSTFGAEGASDGEALGGGAGGGGAGGAEGGAEGGGGGGKGAESESTDDGSDAKNRLVKLECFHCLHLRCAARWWGATRRGRRGRSEEEEKEGSSGGGDGEREEEALLRCPQCREVAEVAAGAAARLDALALVLEASPPPQSPAATAAAAAGAAAPGAPPPPSSAPRPPPPPPSVPGSCWGLALPSSSASARNRPAGGRGSSGRRRGERWCRRGGRSRSRS